MSKGTHIFIEKTRERLLSRDKNYMAFVTGETGSGKSESSLAMAELLDPDFNIDRVFFSVKEFIEMLNEPGLLKPGDVLVGEEMGVLASSRNWQSQQNKQLGAIAQTFRHRNLGLFWTVPSSKFVDIQLRCLAHSIFITYGINFKTHKCTLKHYHLQHNPRTGETFNKRPKYVVDGVVVMVPHITVNQPSKALLSAYKDKKEDFTRKLNIEAEEAFMDSIPKPKPDLKKIAEEVHKNRRKYTGKYQKRKFIDKDLIANDFDIGTKLANRVKKAVESRFTGNYGYE